MAKMQISAAEMLLYRLAAHKVDYAFINSGTDYPPLIEAVAKAGAEGRKIPEIVTCPHENAAMGMAHGYYLGTGRSQAVMVHTDVGLANTACALLNASCNNIPTLLFGGRTPISEHGHFGCRDTPIGYGQEMRDQAALVRESVKWDFELRLPDQMADHVDRAHAIANSLPMGPTYLSLPREPLAGVFESAAAHEPPTQAPARYLPDAEAVKAAAALIAGAMQPVIFAQRGARSEAGFHVLSKLANRWGMPVVEFWGTEIAVSSEDPMYAGGNPRPWLETADAVVVIDSLAPWMMRDVNIQPGCKVVQIGPDPLFVKYPVRGYRADVNLAGETGGALGALLAALEDRMSPELERRLQARVQRVAGQNARVRQQRADTLRKLSQGPITKPFFSRCIGQLAEKHNGRIVSELVTIREFTGLTRHGSYFQEALAGGLGEGFPIALGLQLADRDRLVIAALGDGSYMFSNPVVCHHIAEVMRLPVLVVIGNNSQWGAVAGGTREMYPNGHAARAQTMPAVSLAPSPDFGNIAEAARALALEINTAEELPAALEEAAQTIRRHKRSVLVNVKLAPA